MSAEQIGVLIAALLIGGIAQVLVVRFDLVPRTAKPIDGGRTFHGRPLFGVNKTWRGVFVMTVGTALGAALFLPLAPPMTQPPSVGWAGLGAAMGLGYVVAELPNSFAKRRIGIPPGGEDNRGIVGYLMDQSDSVVGVVLAFALVARPSVADILVLLLCGTLVHIGFDALLHVIGVKGTPHPARGSGSQSDGERGQHRRPT